MTEEKPENVGDLVGYLQQIDLGDMSELQRQAYGISATVAGVLGERLTEGNGSYNADLKRAYDQFDRAIQGGDQTRVLERVDGLVLVLRDIE